VIEVAVERSTASLNHPQKEGTLNEQFVSRLPVYSAKRSADFPAYLVVTCGYEDCPSRTDDRVFLVAERTWLRPLHKTARTTGLRYAIVGRSCPYCFRAGRLPRRRDIVQTSTDSDR